MRVSSRCLLPRLEHPEPSEWSDQDDMEHAVEIELLSLSNPQSGKGDGNLGDRSLWSLLLLLCPWPWDGHVEGSICLWGPHVQTGFQVEKPL